MYVHTKTFDNNSGLNYEIKLNLLLYNATKNLINVSAKGTNALFLQNLII